VGEHITSPTAPVREHPRPAGTTDAGEFVPVPWCSNLAPRTMAPGGTLVETVRREPAMTEALPIQHTNRIHPIGTGLTSALRPRWGLVGVALLVALGNSPAHAQPRDEDAALLGAQAQEPFRRGMARFHSGQFAQARSSFLSAWTLEPHWTIALGLGDCCLKMGRHREAAEHFDYALRTMPPGHPSRPAAEQAMTRLRPRLAALHIEVDRDGAELWVDGIPLGTSPRQGPAYVEPGPRRVEARYPGKDTSTLVDAVAGATHPVRLWVDTPAPDLAADEPVTTTVTVTREPESSSTKTILCWTGLGLTAVAAGVGVAYTLSAESDDTQTPATIAWVSAGLLLGTTGAVYFAWPDEEGGTAASESPSRATWSLAPVVLPGGAAVSWQARLP